MIAAVNGLAYGGGCEITEAVSLAIASERATFAKPEINLGMPPTFGGTQRLPRLAGRKRALELLLTGDPFPAARALELGLVNHVAAHHDLLPAAHELAQRIMRHSPLATASILAAVTRGINASIAPTADLREGLDAWMGRRAPRYIGSWSRPAGRGEA